MQISAVVIEIERSLFKCECSFEYVLCAKVVHNAGASGAVAHIKLVKIRYEKADITEIFVTFEKIFLPCLPENFELPTAMFCAGPSPPSSKAL